MTPIIFQSGIPAVCQNWPEEPQNLCKCPVRCVAHKHKELDCKWLYDQRCAASIASAIPFVESDRKAIHRLVFADASPLQEYFNHWKPIEGKVYMISADHELGWQWLNKNALGGEEWENCTGTVYQMFERSGKYTVRQVMRLTSPDKKEAVEPRRLNGEGKE